jgi:hypothetical protein
VYDSLLLGWYVDHEPPWSPPPAPAGDPRVPTVAPGEPPVPAIIGHLLALAPSTPPILSPQWAQYIVPNVFVPDLWRGTTQEFFTWLATNNGANRLIGSCLLVDNSLQQAYSQWAHDNPTLAFAGDPPAV